MPYNKYIQIMEDRFETLMKSYKQFQNDLDKKDTEPVSIYDPLNPKQLEELMLIREVSRELQKKKEEEIRKAQAIEAESKTAAALKIKENNVNGTEDGLKAPEAVE